MADSTFIAPQTGKVMAGGGLAGEILAGSATPGAPRVPSGDIVDAEFETLGRAAPPHPIPLVQPPPADMPGMDLLRAASAPKASRRAGAGFWAVGALAAGAAFWMSGGHSLSRHLPFAGDGAGTVRVASLKSRVAETAGGPRLFIDGAVENTASASTPAPDLTIQVTGHDGAVTRYRIATAGETIASGGAWRFSSRIDAPDSGVRSVSVTIEEPTRGS
jgi:hypothetical protein